MNWKQSLYIHPRERKAGIFLTTIILLYCFTESSLLSFLENKIGSQRVEIVTAEYPSSLSIIGCHEVNELEISDLIEFGLDSTLAERWFNYRNAIGGMESIDEVKEVFGMTWEIANELSPYLKFEEGLTPSRERNIPFKKSDNKESNERKTFSVAKDSEKIPEKQTPIPEPDESPNPFCINTSAAETFREIRGIGPVYSKRIISYRELLGGYNKAEQLYEVYDIDTAVIKANLDLFIVDSTKVKKMVLDEISFGDLLRHPYTEYEEVQCIFNTKDEMDSLGALSICFEKKRWKKIKPYMKLTQENSMKAD